MEPLAGVLRKAFPDLDQLADVLDRDPELFLVRPRTLAIARTATSDVVAAQLAVLRRARDGVNKIRKSGEAAELDPDERFAMEALILSSGGAALLVCDNTVVLGPGSSLVSAHLSAAERILPGVGRIDAPHLPHPSYFGTGFLVHKMDEDYGLLMTNQHVAAKLHCDGSEHVDFGHEAGGHLPRHEFEIVERLDFRVDPPLDVALLRVCGRSRQNGLLPAPVPLDERGSTVLVGRDVYVVGYPGFHTGFMDDTAVAYMARLFEGTFFIKRLLPGRIVALDDGRKTLYHDCTTLNGSSGSCVVDLETGEVIGLHSGGCHLVHNIAIVMQYLLDSPSARRHRIGADHSPGSTST